MGEDEFEVDIEGEPGDRKTKKMQDPKTPTRTEIEEHNLIHLPFRSWCRHCVRGRGKELPHKRVGEQRGARTPCGHVLLGRGQGSAPHDHRNGGQGAEYQDDAGHGCVSEECEIVYIKDEGGGYSSRVLAGEVGPGAGCQGDLGGRRPIHLGAESCRKQRGQRRRGEGDSERRAAQVPLRAFGPVDHRACCGVAQPFQGGSRREDRERHKGKKDARGQSGELIVSDREGVWRTRTVQRKPIEDRWLEDAQKTWWADAEEDEAQGEAEKLVTEVTEAEKEAEKQVEFGDKILVRFHTRKLDLGKQGDTASCPGCRAALRGTTKQRHTETCRARLFKATADDDRVVESTKRSEEYVARKAEEQDVKKRRVDFENSEKGFQQPFGDKRDDAENSGMDFDGERESENERGHHDCSRKEMGWDLPRNRDNSEED